MVFIRAPFLGPIFQRLNTLKFIKRLGLVSLNRQNNLKMTKLY